MKNIANEDKSSSQYNSRETVGAKILRKIFALIFHILPANAPLFIYTTVLKPRILRNAANLVLKSILSSTLTIPEGRLLLDPNDPVISGALALRAYEKNFAKFFRAELSPGMTVVDAGANIGYYTLIAGKLVGSEGQVIAYEPDSESRSFLEAMTRENNLTNVKALPLGLGDKEETATLYFDPNNRGKHTLLATPGNIPKEIRTTDLDESLASLSVPKVDIIKIDIEGWEAKALKGMHETLQKFHPILFFEFAPLRIRKTGESPEMCLAYLLSLGYQLEDIDERSGKLILIKNIKEFISSLQGEDSFRNIRASWHA